MLEISPKIRTEIVELRKARTTIFTISEKTGTRVRDVTDILKKELGNTYESYSLRHPKRVFSEKSKMEVVALRKSRNTLEAIEDITKFSEYHIRIILEEKLGDEYLRYNRGNLSPKYKKGWSEEDVAEILKLRGSGKSLKDIQRLTGFSELFIKRVLIQDGEDLMPTTWNHKKPLTKEQVVSKFVGWYYKFARAVIVGSPRVLGLLKMEALEIFFGVLEGLPHQSRKIEMLIPVFVYSFFRSKGINVTFPLLRRLSGLTKHECFHMLKKVNSTFPKGIIRDRNLLVIDKIREVESKFKLNSQFFENAVKILQKLWFILNNTTDGVITGTISALALISIHSKLPVLHNICQEIGITQSAVLYQVKKLIKRFDVSGFTTFGGSKELLFSEILEKVVGIQMVEK